MKRVNLILILSILSSLCLFGQIPQGFNYQSVIRDVDGVVLANKSVNLRFTIIQNSIAGDEIYSEYFDKTTNSTGIINVIIGEGTIEQGDFTLIDWSSGHYFLKVELDLLEGNGYEEMGISQLFSVPYALHALTVENVDDADPDPTNEIQDISLNGTELSISDGSTIDLATIQDGVDDADADPENEIQDISLSGTDLSITDGSTIDLSVLQDGTTDADADPENEIQTILYADDSLSISQSNKIKLPIPDSTWLVSGNDIYFNKGKVGIGTATPSSKFVVKGDESSKADDLLFAVVNNTNDTVFAVFQGGVRIYVDDNLTKATGQKAGFAVGGFSSTKGVTNEYFNITPDSVRIYVDDNATKDKGSKGGFAVGGFSSNKVSVNSEFLRVTPDSTRVYVKEAVTKGTKGGFAVGSLSGQSKSLSSNFLDLTPENSFIGQDAGKSNTNGSRNAFIGYRSGFMNTDGFDNVFIGNEAGLENTTGARNIFIGTSSGLQNTTGIQNIAIGLQAGSSLETGLKNVFIGTLAGATNVDGLDNVFIGNYAGWQSTASSNVYIGRTTGMNNTTGTGNVFVGEGSGRSNVEGSGNVFIGREAGMNEYGSNKLYISNSYTSEPLIYGEFDNGLVEVEGSIKLTNILNLKPKTSFPGNPEEGDVLYDEMTHSIKFYNGTEWMELSATASGSTPKVTTDSIPAINILGTSLVVHGNISDQGGSALVQSGFCYSDVPFYDIQFSAIYEQTTPGVGYFVDTLTGLSQYTDYYIRAFAANSEGRAIGEMIHVFTPWASEFPSVTTNDITDIAQTTATGGGEITMPGGTEVIAQGICWSTSPEPTIDNDTTMESVGIGTFISSLTGLTAETTYYVRAYATNSNGTAYGDEVVFTSASYMPIVETDGVVGIAQTTAIGGGNVTMPGGIPITAVGVCWSIASDPSLANDFTTETGVTGTFTSNFSGLIAETTYYVKAYATNSYGTSYGDEVIFKTASDITTVSDIDGNTYNTLQIGTQTWMKENLKTRKYQDGSDIPNVTDNAEWAALTTGAFCWYNNDSITYNATYGTLYNYYAVADSRNVCPVGWHVPTYDEWHDLIDYLGGNSVAGGKLRETGTTHWSMDPGVDNSSGFTALPGGYRYLDYGFLGIGDEAEWLSSTERTETTSWSFYMQTNSLGITEYADIKNGAYSVRCIKD